MAALFALFSAMAFGQGYWGTPIVLTAANPSVTETTSQPRVIFADAGPGPALGKLTWNTTGDAWEWDGQQWHRQTAAGSFTGTGWLILGLVPSGAAMQFTVQFTAPFTPPCTPTTCAAAGAGCGTIPDGCGASLSCGGCPAGQICGGGGVPNICAATPPACVPTTCAAVGASCGTVADGCGGFLSCGGCAAGQTCGGGGIPNACGGACVSGTWSLTAVDSAGDTGRYPALKTDGAGGVHIVYYDVTTHELKHAYRPAGGLWTFGVVDRAPISETLEEASMVIDNAGGLHVSYRRYPAVPDQTLHYAHKPTGGNWAAPEIVERGGHINGNSLDVDAAGGVHISYYNYHSGGPEPVKYLYRPPGGPWRPPEIVASMGLSRTSLTVDQTGVVHVAYDIPGPEIHYSARLPSGVWRPAETVTASNQPMIPSIAVDNTGRLHLAYMINGAGASSLAYASRSPGMPPTGGIWTLDSADPAAQVGQYNSLDLDTTDRPHIAYRDLANHDLKYVFQTSTGAWAPPVVVDSVGQLANYGISLDMAGTTAHIAYYDWTNGDLKYAFRCP